MYKILIISLLINLVWGKTNLINENQNIQIFGNELFKGEFKKISKGIFNPKYKINIGDKLEINLWGEENKSFNVEVDKKGNIFISNYGVLNILNKEYSSVNSIIKKFIQNKNKNVEVYVNLINSQLIKIFISGSIQKPGLYEGNNDDSILKFLDNAGGIKEGGSFRKILILRDNKIIKKIDLYKFLLYGEKFNINFHDGDTIFVKRKTKQILIKGNVFRPFEFEILGEESIEKVLKEFALLKSSSTSFIYTSFSNKKEIIKKYSLYNNSILSEKVKDNSILNVLKDNYSDYIVVKIEGAVYNDTINVFKEGITLNKILEHIELKDNSDINDLMIFRKSVAFKQKKLLDVQLDNLEKDIRTKELTSDSEAKIQNIERDSLLNFIKKARKIKPTGLITLNSIVDFRNFKIEDGDRIFIPKKSNIVLVQGQVQFPSAHIYKKENNILDYIKESGDFSDTANKSKILVIHKNGSTINYDATSWFQDKIEIKEGDSIIVMQNIPTNNWQIGKDITSVIYQIAISTGILIAIF